MDAYAFCFVMNVFGKALYKERNMKNNLFETLKERGLVYQTTDENRVKEILDGEPTTVYVGIDPTADSLHIGHCFSLMLLRYFQEAGHRVIVLLGGATAMIGDPSGKTDMRKMVDEKFINGNYEKIKSLIGRFIKLDGDNPGLILNNAEWFKNYSYIDFMRDVGVHFNVAEMLASDAYSRRLEQGGLTFFEMGYMLMQAYDFVYLNRHYGCKIEIGGSDQWGNILAGAKLGRKMNQKEGKDCDEFHALTCPLLTNSEGKKMGKTEKGALWVVKEKTSVYDFYQYFYNVDDKDVKSLLLKLTRIPVDEIEKIMQGDIREAKKIMAYEITKLVHGKEEADRAVEMSKSIFANKDLSADAPQVHVAKTLLADNTPILDLMVASKLCSSKSEARRLVEQGGVSLDRVKVTDTMATLNTKNVENNSILLQKGKKTFVKVIFDL